MQSMIDIGPIINAFGSVMLKLVSPPLSRIVQAGTSSERRTEGFRFTALAVPWLACPAVVSLSLIFIGSILSRLASTDTDDWGGRLGRVLDNIWKQGARQTEAESTKSITE